TPLLPSKSVSPGDTWRNSFPQAMPYGSGPLQVRTDNTFVHYETVAGTTTAVLTTQLSAPLQFSIPVRTLAGQGFVDADLARQAPHATFVFGGSLSSYQTSWVDPVAGELVQSSVLSDVHETLRGEGFPASATASPVQVGFTGTVSLHLAQIHPRVPG